MPPHRGSAKALTRQRLPSRAIANATQEFVKPRCWMVGDAAQHVGKPSLPSDEPSSARARPDRPSGFFKVLRTRSEHVPSRSRTLPERRRDIEFLTVKAGFGRAPCQGGAFRWVQGPPGDSLQPEAIGAVMEVTKWLKPSISVSRI